MHSREAVHPRMRGEHDDIAEAAIYVGGSSPHARGTHVVDTVRQPVQRFIPACAGNTFLFLFLFLFLSVHPRMRGEHGLPRREWHDAAGSSPHARGTHAHAIRSANAGRFIPACAGNTARYGDGSGVAKVHPRMRGEHTSNKLLILLRKYDTLNSTKFYGLLKIFLVLWLKGHQEQVVILHR